MDDRVLCIGELLWDALPAGLFLGGAPFNVAAHLHALGCTASFAGRVGDDRLGREALRRLRARGLDTSLVQLDDALPTGFVQVALAATDTPTYNIVEPAAWDAIAASSALRRRADRAEALVFGSLAQRASPSRQTIQTLAEDTDAQCVFDLNLRPPFIDRNAIERSLRAADVVKCNADELRRLRSWFALPDEPGPAALTAVAEAFGIEIVCVTEGSDGARLWTPNGSWHHPGYDVAVEDAVGAGDAFLAALLGGLMSGDDKDRLLARANRLGAYVASRSGALPSYSVTGLHDIDDLPLSPQPPAPP